jgi:hypothetical protein
MHRWGPVRQLSGFRCQLPNFRRLLQYDLGRRKYICIGDKACEFSTSVIKYFLYNRVRSIGNLCGPENYSLPPVQYRYHQRYTEITHDPLFFSVALGIF